MPGRVYRQDTPDATHMPVFHQIEGLVDRPGHHLRRPGRHHRRLHQGLLRRRLHVPPAPVVLPVHRAVGRVRHPPARRLVARAGRLRHGPPQRADATAGIDPEEWQGFAFGFGLDRLGASAPRRRPTSASCSPTTSASWSSSEDSPHEGPALLAARVRPVRGRSRRARRRVERPRAWPVEELDRIGEGLDGIVVARVLETRPASEAPTRSSWSTSTPATASPSQICCGAFNMAVGDLVPLATLGTTMPERHGDRAPQDAGRVVQRHALLAARARPRRRPRRHPASCPADLAPGTPFTEALGIEPDVLYDLEINPNRPDAMSVAGVARDLAARLGPAVHAARPPVAGDRRGRRIATASRVEIARPRPVRPLRGPGAARRHGRAGRPELAAARLAAARACADQQRGRRLQLRDARAGPAQPPLRPGQGGRRRASGCGGPRDGETLSTLDDVERTLTADDLLICDGDDAPVGIAGIMGGAASEIGDATTDVLLEMAWFHPIGDRRSPRAASACAPRPRPASRRAPTPRSSTWPRAASPSCSPRSRRHARGRRGRRPTATLPEPRRRCGCAPARVNALLGTDLGAGAHRRAARPDRLRHRRRPATTSTSTIPSWRYDSATEIDVIEEVARHHGYAALGRTRAHGATHRAASPRASSERRAAAPRCSPAAGLRRGHAAAVPRPRRARPLRPARRRHHASPTRWWPRSRCCAPRCCPGLVGGRRLQLVAPQPRRAPVRDRPRVPPAADRRRRAARRARAPRRGPGRARGARGRGALARRSPSALGVERRRVEQRRAPRPAPHPRGPVARSTARRSASSARSTPACSTAHDIGERVA